MASLGRYPLGFRVIGVIGGGADDTCNMDT